MYPGGHIALGRRGQQAEEHGYMKAVRKKTGNQRSEENTAFLNRPNTRSFGLALTTCDHVTQERETAHLHPLLIIALCVVVFLEIHPFQDGN
ncbi:MAG: hypothetical protein ACYDHM_16775, partial [Acidiferrobacterales bacterium]